MSDSDIREFYRDFFKNTELFFERLSSLVKWTTGISVFLITAIIAILTFRDSILNVTEILVLISLAPLMVNVFCGWRILYYVFLLHKIFWYAKDDQNWEKHRKKAGEKGNKIDSFSKWHYCSFLIGFFMFLAFAIFYVITEMLLAC
jgi:hypothetical protein